MMDRTRIAVALGAFGVAAAAATLAGAGAEDAPPTTRTVPATSRCYAVVRAGAVENVVCWDGVEPWAPPAGATLVEVTGATGDAEPGGTWDGAAFAPSTGAAAKAAARAEAIRLTTEADAAAALAALEVDVPTRDALLADETALRAAAAAALARAR